MSIIDAIEESINNGVELGKLSVSRATLQTMSSAELNMFKIGLGRLTKADNGYEISVVEMDLIGTIQIRWKKVGNASGRDAGNAEEAVPIPEVARQSREDE